MQSRSAIRDRAGDNRSDSMLQRASRHAPLAGIALLVVASWMWLLYQEWAMRHMDIVDMAMPSRGPWGIADLLLVFVMWAIMMVAMMLPSAVPVALLYRQVVAGRESDAPAGWRTSLFVAGYLIAWTAFSAVATAAQWALHESSVLSPAMQINAPVVGAATLVLAGIYQWSPLKGACLSHCRSPLAFLLNGWQAGNAGALAMGLRHGSYCTGCCWLLMAVLFVVGVMNLAWVAAIALLVLLEKVLPGGHRLAQVTGASLIAWGGWLLL